MIPPILLLIFNRPDTTEQVFSRLKRSKPSRLYIAADGPRSTRKEENILCERARLATERIDWPCDVKRLYRKKNLGCKLAVSSAITWFFEHESEGIILEDDCLPDPTFFRFCGEMLSQYRSNLEIGLISGTNFYDPCAEQIEFSSYRLSRFPHIWGWATWRRVWKDYDVELSGWSGDWDGFRADYPNRMVRSEMANWFNSVKHEDYNTWDYQLVFLLSRRRLFSIIPNVNLVQNIGFGSDATHTTSTAPELPISEAMEFPLHAPRGLKVDQKADKYLAHTIYGIPTGHLNAFGRKCRKVAKRLLGKSW